VIPMRPSPKSLTRRSINSAAEPHGRTAAGSLDQNDAVVPAPVAAIALQNKALVYDILFKAAAECPAKAGMFSRRKACRGKSQKPRSLDSRVAGNQDSEAYRQRLPSGRRRVTGP